MAIEAVVFDLDDTLFDEINYVKSGYNAVSNFCFEKYSVKDFYYTLVNEFNAANDGRVFNRALCAVNIEDSRDVVLELVEVYRNHTPVIRLRSDADWAIQKYASMYKIGIITDGYSVTQHKKIEALKIFNSFDCIIISDDLGGKDCWKPSERPYHEIEKRLDVRGENCVYIGDNVTKDFVTAKKLGWYTICLKKNIGIYAQAEAAKEYLADQDINNLKELETILG